MPYSAGENKEFVSDFIQEIKPRVVYDIGPGAGFYVDILKEVSPSSVCIGVEIYEPYVQMFSLGDKYDSLLVTDVRDVDSFDSDLVIAGDVLEHMSESDMKVLVDRILSQAKWLVISVPIIHYPQGHSHGNAHEEHLQEDINKETLVKLFGEPFSYKEYSTTGTFIYKGI